MSIIPLNTSTVPLQKPPSITTTDLNIDPDCNLTDVRTTMQVDKQTVHILCALSTSKGPQPFTFKLYKFNGTATESLGSLMGEGREIMDPEIRWSHVPNFNGSATWAYAFGTRFKTGYEISFVHDNSQYMFNPKYFEVDNYISREQFIATYPNYDGRHTYNDDGVSNLGVLIPILLVGVAALSIGTLLYVLIVRRRRRSRPYPTLNNGVPLNPLPAVHREVYGEDASDELPKYTPHDASGQVLVSESLGQHDPTNEPPSYTTSMPESPPTADTTTATSTSAATATATATGAESSTATATATGAESSTATATGAESSTATATEAGSSAVAESTSGTTSS
ncbi:hypothetical protein B0O80DRAFT_240280 [Mortierella sp. GBAus27b]|nr:hypothetical protein B0O80DRAFT_240280 [Mortierella sp. GBAus27b]